MSRAQVVEVLELSEREVKRVGIVAEAAEGRLRYGRAAELLSLSVRQVKRLVHSYRQSGAAGLRSQRRGRPSNRCHEQALREQVLSLEQDRYTDFGPTLLAEYLEREHAIQLSPETLRQWLITAGRWHPKRRRRARHLARNRRPRFGELIQIDGSPHAWFEDRSPRCTMIVFIDDATSRVLYARFVEAETTQAYFDGFAAHWRQAGLPLAYYSDRHSIFRVNQNVANAQPTQAERALQSVGVQLICAHSPQAKGRVERVHQTLQDRLVKALRLAKIDTLEAANAFLDTYLPEHNQRFAKPPLEDENAHRPLALDEPALRHVLSQQYARKVNAQGGVLFQNRFYRLPRQLQRRFMGQTLTIAAHPAGVTLLHEGHELPYEVMELALWRAQVADRKVLDAQLDRRVRPDPVNKPKATHPWKGKPQPTAQCVPAPS